MSITPEQLAASGTEEGHQAAFFCRIALEVANNGSGLHPYKWVHHIPNGGSRGDTKLTASKQGALMKKIGVKKGVLDVFFPYPVGALCGLYIEFKSPSGKGELSPEQLEFIKYLYPKRFAIAIVDDWQDAFSILECYCENKFMQSRDEGLLLDDKGYVKRAWDKQQKKR